MKEQDLGNIQRVYELGFDINAIIETEFGDCIPLLVACQNGHEKLVKFYLQHGANVNIADEDKYTSLIVACQEGHDKCVSLLLENGADVNQLNNLKTTPLYMACQKGFDKCAVLLLKYVADVNLMSISNCTALFMASQFGHDECVSLLSQYGADTNVPITLPNGKITSPLLIASKIGFIKCVAFLLLHGADVDAVDENQETSAYATSLVGNVDCLSLLISYGADVNIPNKRGITPLKIAYSFGFEKCVSLLVENGSDELMDPAKPANENTTPAYLKKKQNYYRQMRRDARHCDYPECNNTDVDVKELKKCSRCNAVYYCSAEHQKLHWKEHKKLCKEIAMK